MIVFTLESADEQAFMGELSRDYKRLMFSTARKYTANCSDQEDIVQNALVALMKKISVIRPLPSYILAGYVVSTVRNTAKNHLKWQSRQRSHCDSLEDESFMEPPTDTPSLDELMILAERRERLAELWSHLSEEDRILLVGKYIWGYTDKELATQLKCRVDNIRMRLSRARRRALKLLNEREEGAVL